jgi:DNA-binding transcriptional LysR family regulator
MEIRQLQYFKQVCKDKSLSKAAENLYITQQGLSHAILTLEKEIGVALFLRSKNGVVPTEAAANFLDEVSEVLDAFEALKKKMRTMAESADGKVRVSLTPGAMSYLVPKLVSEFHERYPKIELKIVENPDTLCEEYTANGEVDIACTTGPIANEALEWFPLFKDSVVIMMRKDNPLASREILDFEDLKNEKFILMPRAFKWHDIIIGRCKEAGYDPDIFYEVGDLNVTYNIIKENGGIGFMHQNLAESFGVRETTIVPLAADEKLYWHLGLVKKRRTKLSYAAQIVAGYISEISGEHEAFAGRPNSALTPSYSDAHGGNVIRIK